MSKLDSVLPSNQLKQLIDNEKRSFTKGSAYEGVLTALEPQRWKVFIRNGTQKVRGFQITFREQLKRETQSNGGYLLCPRGKGYLIPLGEVRELVAKVSESHLERATFDIFIAETDDGIVMRYHQKECKIDKFSLS